MNTLNQQLATTHLRNVRKMVINHIKGEAAAMREWEKKLNNPNTPACMRDITEFFVAHNTTYHRGRRDMAISILANI